MTINYLLFNTQIIQKLSAIADNEKGNLNLDYKLNIIRLINIDKDEILTLYLQEHICDSYDINTAYCENKVELIDIVNEYIKIKKEENKKC